jgi:hypothetical protein
MRIAYKQQVGKYFMSLFSFLEILLAIKRFLFASNKTFSKLALQKSIARRVLLLTNEEKVHTSPSFLVSELDLCLPV